MTSDWPCDVTADQLTTDPLRYAQTSMFVLIVESFDLSLESERDLKLSTNKQLKRQRCWLTANQPSQQQTTWEIVHSQLRCSFRTCTLVDKQPNHRARQSTAAEEPAESPEGKLKLGTDLGCDGNTPDSSTDEWSTPAESRVHTY